MRISSLILFLIPEGPKPGVPHNVTIVDQSDAFSIGIHWMPPIDADRVAVAYYRIQYKSDSGKQIQPIVQIETKVLPIPS